MSTIEYRVSLALRARHLYEIEARFPVGDAAAIDLQLPVWTPGSYLIREYERHLQELGCSDGEGRTLPVRKIDKSTWRVQTDAARMLVVRYRVYAHELTVRTAHLDGSHAFWNGACLFFYVEALRERPVRVIVGAPEGWRIATGLAPDESTPSAFVAPSYDALVDAPFEVGPGEHLSFTAAGRPHTVAVWGRPAPGPYDLARFVEDLRKIVESHAARFGGVPYERYTFLVELAAGMQGGLEHANSSTLLVSPFAFTAQNRYQDLLELASHEFFHLWNVKRIHPEALGPFHYQREAYTRSLWVVEGWTSYYDRLTLVRAGLLPAARYREKLGEELTKLASIPGRRRHSLEESSFDAWIKLYRPDENSVNSTVSYYLKGSLVALLLDLEIRRRSGGARSLDHALTALWNIYGERGVGYPDAAVQPLVEEAAGLPLEDFFARAVRGREELDLDGPLASVGLCVKRTVEGSDDDGAPRAWLGANLAQEGDRLRVTETLDEGPAQSAGLCPGDQVVACDGFRVDATTLKERLSGRRPGDPLRLTVFRRDELAEISVPLGTRLADQIEVVPVDDPPQAAKDAYQAWLAHPWEKAVADR